MMTSIIGVYEIVLLSAGIVGVYIRINNEVSKLKNRVYTLEQSKHEVTDMLKELSEDIQEIKLLLARKQIDL
jgi:prefoldin subunit 5|tara:strand:- start:105 stop:320 length:216 start_codon:yes stop_codon:yes gene_type:complete